MDPTYITTEIWQDISTALRLLWLYVFLILGFATNFLIAHALIPSLASTRQIPDKLVKLRALVYLMAFGALGLAILIFVGFLLNLDVLGRVWPRWWL
ncbi:MAG: hypothetical protein HY532_07715 [Chloroflexi bacterium]|nr:hypothetical protein [Chloroflexota bacterium]